MSLSISVLIAKKKKNESLAFAKKTGKKKKVMRMKEKNASAQLIAQQTMAIYHLGRPLVTREDIHKHTREEPS